mmetsp:Transcript_67631/g.119973  ORF Transcript_67631/g.119973 Transcript_67631/m.119973 type:complete len:138 (-) Transcript_67631:1931-2344(-)
MKELKTHFDERVVSAVGWVLSLTFCWAILMSTLIRPLSGLKLWLLGRISFPPHRHPPSLLTLREAKAKKKHIQYCVHPKQTPNPQKPPGSSCILLKGGQTFHWAVQHFTGPSISTSALKVCPGSVHTKKVTSQEAEG